MHRGYIKLWKKLKDSDFWVSEKFSRAQAFVDLVMLANYKDSYFRARGQRIDVKRGQLAYSELTLAERWKWSRGKVRRFLSELESQTEQKIVQHKSNLTTLITIVNYDIYQGDDTALDTPDGTTDSTANGTHLYKVKKDKNKEATTGRGSRHKLPPDFILSEELIAFAQKQGINGSVETTFDQFCDYHRAKGDTMLDWTAAWRTWVRNEIKFSKGKITPKKSGVERTMKIFAEREHERREQEKATGCSFDADGELLPTGDHS